MLATANNLRFVISSPVTAIYLVNKPLHTSDATDRVSTSSTNLDIHLRNLSPTNTTPDHPLLSPPRPLLAFSVPAIHVRDDHSTLPTTDHRSPASRTIKDSDTYIDKQYLHLAATQSGLDWQETAPSNNICSSKPTGSTQIRVDWRGTPSGNYTLGSNSTCRSQNEVV